MYFHLIGIKEKFGKQYEIDLMVYGDDENVVRDFLSHRGVVIVSLSHIKDEPVSLGNIVISIPYASSTINLYVQGEELEDTVYYWEFLGLSPQIANFTQNPISQEEMQSLLQRVSEKISAENEERKLAQEQETLKEQQKYEEESTKIGLRAINDNIDEIQQVIKAGEGILSETELKELEDCLNNMKKIRLGTNFNKMADVVFDSHSLVKIAEEKILSAQNAKKFEIDENSSVTNVDIISELFKLHKSNDKAIFKPIAMDTTETFYNRLGSGMVYLQLLKRDISDTFSRTSFDEFFSTLTNVIEYFVGVCIFVVSILRLIAPILGFQNFSLYLLPALGWLGLLLYLFNNLTIESRTFKILGFIALAIIYRYGLKLLLNTFAM